MSAIIKFPHKVRYKGETIPAHKNFEVPDEDLDMMVKAGCFIVKEDRQTRRKGIKTALDIESKVDNDPKQK